MSRFYPLLQEQQLSAMLEFFHFKRHHAEPIDAVLSRYELIRHRAQQLGHLEVNSVGASLMLLNILHIPRSAWQLILQPTQGQFPEDAEQYTQFMHSNFHRTLRFAFIRQMAFRFAFCPEASWEPRFSALRLSFPEIVDKR